MGSPDFEKQLREFLDGRWGKAAADPESASGTCKRASLALMARLDRAGVEVELWSLAGPRHEAGWCDEGHHFVIAHQREAIDVTARQFDPTLPVPLRESIEDAKARWDECVRVKTDDPLDCWLHNIPPNWRELADRDPPGDLPGYPFPLE